MNRWRQRSVAGPAGKLRARNAGHPSQPPIDLGFALSVYGKNADGKLVEIHGDEASAALEIWTSVKAWPTEQ